MHSVRRNKSVKTRLSFGQKAYDFFISFFERSNIHGFFYFSRRVLHVLEKFVHLPSVHSVQYTSRSNYRYYIFADYFGLRWWSVRFGQQLC